MSSDESAAAEPEVDSPPAQYRVPYLAVGSLLGQAEIDAVAGTLRSGATLSCGPERDAFEREFADYVGVRHALSVTNCTVALEFATHLVDLKPGDEVIATPQTYQATTQPLLGRDVNVRFCDIDPDTLNVDPESFATMIGPRTRALYLVHHGGRVADMDAIMEIARERGVLVVEDCAHAIGASLRGRRPGALGHIGCFSFQSYKNITTLGEGGMITFEDDGWAETIHSIRAIEPQASFVPRASRSIGPYHQPNDRVFRHDKNAYTHDCIGVFHPGTNSTLPEPAAAVGRVQLRRADEFARRRANIAAHLDASFRDLPGVRIQQPRPGYVDAHHLYTLFLEPDSRLDRDQIAAAIEHAGVQVQLRYFPLHLLPEWRMRGSRYGDCPVTERVWFTEQLQLPIYPQMEEQMVDIMIDVVSKVIRTARRWHAGR